MFSPLFYMQIISRIDYTFSSPDLSLVLGNGGIEPLIKSSVHLRSVSRTLVHCRLIRREQYWTV